MSGKCQTADGLETMMGTFFRSRPKKEIDPESKKFYNGVFVSAYVSKGAQDTWEKVLDGTLAGFSIGGRMNKWDDAYDEKSDKSIRVIKQYDLVELSLVDSPANQFANIVSVEKVDGVDVIKADETVLENVFYDKENGIVLASENESELSPITGEQMENIGFVEKTDNEKVTMIKFLVDSAKGINTSKINKEENLMAKSTKNTVEEIVEKSDIAVEVTEVAPEADAKADVVETTAEEVSTEKAAKAPSSGEEDAEEDAAETPADEEAEAKKPMAPKSDEVVAEAPVAEAVTETNDGLEKAFSDLVEVVKSLQTEVEAVSAVAVGASTVAEAASTEAVAASTVSL